MKHSRVRGSRLVSSSSCHTVAIAVRGLAALMLVGACLIGFRELRPSRSALVGEILLAPPASSNSFSIPSIQSHGQRLVYPYSVVPGGVLSSEELHQAASHDRVVAQHYSGFDYQHARVVKVERPKLVYLSYRIGNNVYWTSKQATLRAGEELITDGRITARTRCGNQVSVLPQVKTSTQEPMMEALDRPDAVASGFRTLPSGLESNLFDVDPAMPLQASGGRGYPGPPGAFMPFPIGGGGKSPTTSGGGCTGADCNPVVPPGAPPSAVPEPTTLVLVLTGAAAVLARAGYRKN